MGRFKLGGHLNSDIFFFIFYFSCSPWPNPSYVRGVLYMLHTFWGHYIVRLTTTLYSEYVIMPGKPNKLNRKRNFKVSAHDVTVLACNP